MDVYIMWPEVSRYYDKCETNKERLKQRIRRALEKKDMEKEEFLELAEMLYEKLEHLAQMQPSRAGVGADF